MMSFKIDFDIKNYKDILPEMPDDSEFLNVDKEVEDQFWRKLPTPAIVTHDFILQEAKRIKQGVWILIKGTVLWIPGNYYFFLQYWNAAGKAPQFRLKRLKLVYQKLRVRKNPSLIGTYVIKNRKDGETLFSVCDGIWEVLIEEQKHGAIAMQSKNRDTVVGSCWKSLISGWNGLRPWVRDSFFADFSSGGNIAEQLKFQSPANPLDPMDMGKNVNIVYGPCVYNAFDAYADIIRLILDEVTKWPKDCSFYDCFINYKKIILPGAERKGLFDIMSSPADTEGVANKEAFTLWNLSDPEHLDEFGCTDSRLWAYYSNPLEGIEGFYDKYGDADPDQIYEHIMRERKGTPRDKLMNEIRAFPLPIKGTGKPNLEELFGAVDSNRIWMNTVGITRQKLKIQENKPAYNIYGNLVWPQNIKYAGVPVFVAADTMQFNDEDARFCVSATEIPKEEIGNIKNPPKLITGVIGCDPYNGVYHNRDVKKQSIGAAIGLMFKSFTDPKFIERPLIIYGARPYHKNIFFDDMVKMCVYTGFMMQYENSDNGALEEHFRQEEMDAWLLDSRDGKLIETPKGTFTRKGDAPSGNGAKAFTTEIMNLIDGYFSAPYNKDENGLTEEFYFEEVLSDILEFDPKNTQYNHFTMAFGQCMIGKVKLLFQKRRKKEPVNNQMLGYVYS